MRISCLLAVLALLMWTGTANADVGPKIPSADIRNSPPWTTALAGIGLAALVIFGGFWFIRNPQAGLGLALGVPGGLLAVFGLFVLLNRAVGGLICLLPG